MQAYVCLKCADEFRSFSEWEQHMKEHYKAESVPDNRNLK